MSFAGKLCNILRAQNKMILAFPILILKPLCYSLLFWSLLQG